MIYDQLLRFLISIAHPSDAATAKTAIAIPSDVAAGSAGATAVSATGTSATGSTAASGASSIISSSTMSDTGQIYYHAVLITVSQIPPPYSI